MFVAPILYGVHAVFSGLAFFVMYISGAKLGYTFSQGFIDYILFFAMDTKPWMVLILGPLYGLGYYSVFRFLIYRLDLATPGRKTEVVDVVDSDPASPLAQKILAALGGRDNVNSLDACITRLRVDLVDPTKANHDQLKGLGAAGVIMVGNGIQAIFGTNSDNIKTQIEEYIQSLGTTSGAGETMNFAQHKASIIAAIGHRGNILKISPVAYTRLKLEVSDMSKVNFGPLPGNFALQKVSSSIIHLLAGTQQQEVLKGLMK